MTGQIVSATEGQAVAVLTEAFAEDPAFVHFTQGLAAQERKAMHRRLVRWIVRFHHLSGQPILGWQVGGQILGCALVVDRPASLRRAVAFLRLSAETLRFPFSMLGRLNRYAVLSARGRPEGVSHVLVLLGIAAARRGQGHGRRFLEALHRHFGPAAHWALDTENPDNQRFYARLGYRLYATETLGAAEMFKLHRAPRP
jgi:GNAT superfamily N-acetyltransferase